MPDPWLLVPPGHLAPGEVELEPEEARHLRSVLRRTRGARVVLADGRGSWAGGTVVSVERNRVVVAVDRVERMPRPAGPAVTAALGILQGQAMDWAVTKAVELGVRRFVPVAADRSQGGIRAAERRLAHWRRVARQALKQCRRPWEMQLEDPVTLGDLLAGVDGEAGIVADPGGRAPSRPATGRGRFLLVGPEGGFTTEERRDILAAGWTPVRLGAHVLRAETALVVGVAVLGLCGE